MKEKTTFRGNPRARMNEWVKHELRFFPGLEKLDKLLFTTSFAQIPDNVALLPYSATGEILDYSNEPFGTTNSARHSDVRIDMASRINPYRSIIFSKSKTGESTAIQTGRLNNGVTLVAQSILKIEHTGQKPNGETQLQTIMLSNEDENHVVEIRMRMDPTEKRIWYSLTKIENESKETVNVRLDETKNDTGDTIYVISANIDNKTVHLPIPESVLPREEFPNKQEKPV